jgi:hypothetical protein
MNGKGSTQSVFFLDCCEGPIPETSGPADVPGGYSLASARILKLFGRQRGQLPIQILFSVALDSCGGNSPAAKSGQIKKLRGVFAVFPDATEALNVAFAR